MKLDHLRLAAAALLVSACAHPPLAELDAAWRAYQTASSAGAADKAPDRFQEAGAALVEGQDYIDRGEYDQAREALKRARRLADAASGGQGSVPRDEGLAEPRADAGFTDAPTSNEGVQLSPLVKPGASTRAAPAPTAPEPAVPSAPAPAPAGAAAAAADTASDDVPSTMVDGALPERIEAPSPDVPLDARRELPGGDGVPRQAPSAEETARAIREERERLKQAAAERAAAESAPAAAPPVAEAEPEEEEESAAPAAAPAPAAPAPRTHVVKKGETLYEIARTHYKTEAAWKVIYDANRDRLANPGDVRAGMTLVLPPASAAAAGASGSAPSTQSAAQTYTVRKGENLHTIAEKMYGAQSYWTLIRDANKDKLSDADEVRAGTKLVLPPKPGSR